MIEKIGLDLKGFRNKDLHNKQPQDNNYQSKQNFNKHLNPELLKNYYVPSFTGKINNKSMSKREYVEYAMSTPSKYLVNELKQSAKDTGYNEITVFHVMKHSLEEGLKYIDELNKGKKDFVPENQPPLPMILAFETTVNAFAVPENRNKIRPVIEQELKNVKQIIEGNKPDTQEPVKEIKLSDDLVDSIWAFSKEDVSFEVTPYTIVSGAYNSPVHAVYDITRALIFKVDEALMMNKKPAVKRSAFTEYEVKAGNVLKNLALGTNIFLTYDAAKEEPEYFINAIHKLAEKENNGRKMLITEFNTQLNDEFLHHKVTQLAKDKNNQHIIIFDPINLMRNSSSPEQLSENTYAIPSTFVQLLTNPPSNIKIVMYDTKNNYYNFIVPNLGPAIKNFEEATVPALSTKQMIKSFKENPDLMKDIKKPFTKNAIDKTVEAAAQLDGAFPQKVQKLMKQIVSYYIDKKDINEKDIANYVKEATNLFRKGNEDSSVEVVFDTGKSLKQMVGKDSTKKEAKSLIKQIKSNKMGTKGVLIYSQDGSAGGGRRFTSQAIAGDAKVPYIEINTMDFGTKEVGIFGGAGVSPEASMKKLFSIVTTQAEANANKSAVLFIENFEYFSIGELVSMYHQKAMAQLLREMEKADKEGLNILVMGSVSNPDFIGEAAMKSFKFVDSIEVSSPAFNEGERAEIIADTIKKTKVKLEGNPKEQQEIINLIAKVTNYFPHIYLKNIVKKAQSVAIERGHKVLTKADFTEAYLQITTGRPSTNKIYDHEKEIVTSHECGHATNVEVMNNLIKKYGTQWQLPGKVNFVTLDPRGWFGGAVYLGDDKNKAHSFEKEFSDIVCSYGGHSAEKLFYGMDGSYGISADLQNATHKAEVMVKVMGQGANTGKISLYGEQNLSPRLKNAAEKDMQVILNNALNISDLITETYSDFNHQFTQKYSHLVGTGECLVDGDIFRKELQEWKDSQSKEKQEELKNCDELILDSIKKTKKGIID